VRRAFAVGVLLFIEVSFFVRGPGTRVRVSSA
jgi:hypothetical protein